MEGPHCIGVDGARGIGLGGYRQGSAQVIDHGWLDLFHHIQDMVKVSQVSSYQFNLVEYIAQSLRVRADMEDNWSLFSSIEQQTYYLSADKTCAARDQYRHGNLLNFLLKFVLTL